MKWNEFWELIGAPPHAKPLVLSGWAFSSDRGKRDRFIKQIRYATEDGRLDEAEAFITSLRPADWHTCSPSGLDWNYGEALAEDMRRKEAHLDEARQIYQALLHASDSPAYRREFIGETLCLYHLHFRSTSDTETRITSLREALESYKHLGDDCDPPLWHDTDQAVIDQLDAIAKSKQIELLLESLIARAAASHQGSALGRAEIEEFLEDMWSP